MKDAANTWTSSPLFCPFCGGKKLVLNVDEGLINEADHAVCGQSGQKLSEHQCQDCEGRPFWS